MCRDEKLKNRRIGALLVRQISKPAVHVLLVQARPKMMDHPTSYICIININSFPSALIRNSLIHSAQWRRNRSGRSGFGRYTFLGRKLIFVTCARHLKMFRPRDISEVDNCVHAFTTIKTVQKSCSSLSCYVVKYTGARC